MRGNNRLRKDNGSEYLSPSLSLRKEIPRKKGERERDASDTIALLPRSRKEKSDSAAFSAPPMAARCLGRPGNQQCFSCLKQGNCHEMSFGESY